MKAETEDKGKGNLVLKFSMEENALLSVRTFAKSIAAFAKTIEAVAKDMKTPSEIMITDLACFEEDGKARYVIEVVPVPKDAKIGNVRFVPNVEDKYKDAPSAQEASA